MDLFRSVGSILTVLRKLFLYISILFLLYRFYGLFVVIGRFKYDYYIFLCVILSIIIEVVLLVQAIFSGLDEYNKQITLIEKNNRYIKKQINNFLLHLDPKYVAMLKTIQSRAMPHTLKFNVTYKEFYELKALLDSTYESNVNIRWKPNKKKSIIEHIRGNILDLQPKFIKINYWSMPVYGSIELDPYFASVLRNHEMHTNQMRGANF